MATITTKVATLNLQKRVHFHSSKFHFDSEKCFFFLKKKKPCKLSVLILLNSNSSRLIMTYHFQVIIFKYSIS